MTSTLCPSSAQAACQRSPAFAQQCGDAPPCSVLPLCPDAVGEPLWGMQVSGWREGRVISLETAEQSIVVEPWQRGRAQPGGAARWPHGDMDEDEHPPTEYDEDGVLRTALHSFSDLRIIQDMASRSPISGVGTSSPAAQASVNAEELGCTREQRSGRKLSEIQDPGEACYAYFISK